MNPQYFYLNPGYIFFSTDHFIVETVLGSCIAVCLWDKRLKIGGINHFILPIGEKESEKNGKYGNYSTEYLIKIMLRNGSMAEDLTAAVVGGAKHRQFLYDVGEKNKETAKEILRKFGITIYREVTGGFAGRKLKFDTFSGNVEIYDLKEMK